MKLSSLAFFFDLALLPSSLKAQATQRSPKTFVQKFYAWYVPIAHTNRSIPAFVTALNRRGSVFSKNLASQLQIDRSAQIKAGEDLVGLDFDPFLDSQDPESSYAVGKIERKGSSYWVTIQSASSGDKPAVIAEVKLVNDKWVFANFHYPTEAISQIRLVCFGKNVTDPDQTTS